MGLIKKLFGGIFALLGGILKIFGIGKSDYYMEVEGTAAPTAAPAAQPAVTEPSPVVAAAPAPVAPAPTVVAAPPAPVAPAKPKPEPGLTFAPTFLVPSLSGGRRRPGPSLDAFMDMAKQVKS
jgi:hypothetical protein